MGRRAGTSGPHVSEDEGLFEMKEKLSVAVGARAKLTGGTRMKLQSSVGAED